MANRQIHPDPIIVSDGLTRRFGTKVAVDHLTLEVYAGEVFGFLGHNGAGKTTTVRLLNGILTPQQGTATVLGLSPVREGPALRKRSGVLTETPSLEERLTARQNLQIYADLYGVPEAKVPFRIEQVLTSFGLEERADEKVGGYSKGMRQRLALARTLLHGPEVIFLDEPTAGLDPAATRHVHLMIEQLSHEEGRTIFLCTHNLTEAQALCDRVAVLAEGRLLAVGTPRDLARQLGPSQRLEIEVAPPDVVKAVETMERGSHLKCQAGDDGLIEVIGVERQAIPGLIAALVECGTRVFRVAAQEASLEDVYFTLQGQERRGL